MTAKLTAEEIQVLAYVRSVRRTHFSEPAIRALAVGLWNKGYFRREIGQCDWLAHDRVYYTMTAEGNAIYCALGRPTVTRPIGIHSEEVRSDDESLCPAHDLRRSPL